MDIRKRKISFNYITLDTEVGGINVQDEFIKIIEFIKAQSNVGRKRVLTPDKFCLLDESEFNTDRTIKQITFKSAVHSYRAPLLDKETVDERENPKRMNEGEKLKTHFAVRFKDGDLILLAEKFRGALSVAQFIDYLNQYKYYYENVHDQKLNYKFGYDIIAKDNLDEELENMTRVSSTSIYVDKQLLGSEALNFSERLDTVQQNIIIDIKASRTQSIKDTTKDVLAQFMGGQRKVMKVRIKGKNSAENDITIDTDFIEKREYIDARLNPDTGEVNSEYLMYQLVEIANSL